MQKLALYSAVLAGLLVLSPACADEPQSLGAQVGGSAFASDDDGILLVPVPGSFTLSASTAGASSYPPPKTPIDRLSIMCDAYTPGQPLVLDSKRFASSNCNVSFTKGEKGMGAEPDAKFEIDKASAANRFEITSSHGKVIEGTFQFDLTDAAGKPLQIRDGHFKAEDRQL